jgi:cell division protein FtsQ
VQPGAPTQVRGLPLELEDDDAPPGQRKRRFGAPTNPWWRPTGTWGRAALIGGAIVALSAFAYAIHACKSYLEHDARFRVAGTGDIQAAGLVEVTRAEMLPVFGEDIGRNIFFVPIAERRKQLEQIPWIEQATVMRLLPDQIRVSIVERQPVAFVRHGQQIGLVDANGVLLNMPPALLSKHHYSFPVLTGIDSGDPLPSRKARIELYQRLVGELDGNGQHLSDQISEIDLTDPEDARVLMPEQGSDILAHFGQDRFLDRYQRYKTHITEWRQQYPKLSAVDLRYDQQVVLQMVPGSTTEEASLAPASGNAHPSAKPPAGQLLEKPEAQKVRHDVPKVAKGLPPAKSHPSVAMKAGSSKKTPSKTRSEHENELSARTHQKKESDAKHAALKQTKPKSSTKPRPSVAQGQ